MVIQDLALWLAFAGCGRLVVVLVVVVVVRVVGSASWSDSAWILLV